MITHNTLKSFSRTSSKRVGRGNASGKGTTAGRGMNGQNSRSGGGVPDWFEGGQTPLFRRMPKLKGFSNARFKKKFMLISLADIQKLSDEGVTEINNASLRAHNVISGKELPIKLLADGVLQSKVTVEVDAVTDSAHKKLESTGSTLIMTSQKQSSAS